MAPRPKTRRKRAMRAIKRVPFLPSLITLGNAFCGFLAIAWTIDAAELYGKAGGQVTPELLQLVEYSCFLLFLAMFFDALDGKVARLTHQATAFGTQLDSMADVVTFGVAPALIGKLVFDVYFPTMPPKFSYLCAALFALCAILRLARFNVETPGLDEDSHRRFKGLPTPAAAAIMASLLLFAATELDPRNTPFLAQVEPRIYHWVHVMIPFATVGCGLLMVSNLPYPHLLNSVLKRRRSFPALAFAVFLVLLAPLAWHEILMSMCCIYLASGPVVALYEKLVGHRLLVDEDEDDEDEDEFEHEEEHEDEPDHEAGDGGEHRGSYPGPGSRIGG